MKGIIQPIPLPFDPDEKAFSVTDDEGNQIGEKYSHSDFLDEILSIGGLTEKHFGRNGGIVRVPDEHIKELQKLMENWAITHGYGTYKNRFED